METDASDVEDPSGTLVVEVRIDAGPWTTAAWNPTSSRYEWVWDTTTTSDGPHTVTVRFYEVGGESPIYVETHDVTTAMHQLGHTT